MNLLFEQRAEIALRSLRGADEKQIKRALSDLLALVPEQIFRHHKIHKLRGPLLREPLYVYGDAMRLRIVFAIQGINCRIIDIVDHDRLERLLVDGGQR